MKGNTDPHFSNLNEGAYMISITVLSLFKNFVENIHVHLPFALFLVLLASKCESDEKKIHLYAMISLRKAYYINLKVLCNILTFNYSFDSLYLL